MRGKAFINDLAVNVGQSFADLVVLLNQAQICTLSLVISDHEQLFLRIVRNILKVAANNDNVFSKRSDGVETCCRGRHLFREPVQVAYSKISSVLIAKIFLDNTRYIFLASEHGFA